MGEIAVRASDYAKPHPAARQVGIDELIALHENRPTRAYLRVSFPFSFLVVTAPLAEVGPRHVVVRRRTWREAKVLVFTGDDPMPQFWVWTLDDERGGTDGGES